MKLKYYLRGLGVGILFATIIMAISSEIHKNDISDDEIIKRAQKLGMVMAEDTETEGGLWDSTEDTESEQTEKPNSTETQNSQNTENSTENTTEKGTEKNSEKNSEKNTEKNTEKNSEKNSESKKPLKDTKKDYIQITIHDSDAARQVAATLYYNGLVKDPEDFRQYLAKKGYATRIRSGTFEIPVGASYKEICDIIVNK